MTPDADTLNQWEYLKHLTFMGAKERYRYQPGSGRAHQL
jgi:DNA polymerase-3 subunit alpha